MRGVHCCPSESWTTTEFAKENDLLVLQWKNKSIPALNQDMHSWKCLSLLSNPLHKNISSAETCEDFIRWYLMKGKLRYLAEVGG